MSSVCQNYIGRVPNSNWLIKQKINWQDRSMKKIYAKNYIKELRDERGLTLRDLENLTGWSNQTLSNLELSKAELTWSKITKLAEVFDVEPLVIMEGHDGITQSQEEKELLEHFRKLEDSAKQMYFHTVKSFATEAKETNKPTTNTEERKAK